MHDIKLIRKKFDFFLEKLNQRSIKIDFKILLNLDKENRDLIQKREKLEQEKKIISQKKDKSQFSRSKDISAEIEKINQNESKIKRDIEDILSSLPNISLDDVPVGKDESFNKVIETIGEIPKFDFTPKKHDEIGKKLNLMEFDTASKVSGSRFVFLKDKLALL